MSSRPLPSVPRVAALARGPEVRTPSRSPTSLASWGLAMARALESRGCHAQALFARAGLDFAALGDPEARYPQRAISELWRLSVEATGDPCFGLEVARHTSPTTFHALGFSLAASSTVHEALERVVRYYRLVSDEATIAFEERDDAYRLSARPVGRHSTREAMDALLAVAVRLCRSLTDRSFAPLRVDIEGPPPRDPLPFTRYFKAPVLFDAAEHALLLGREQCDRVILGANPELARSNDRIAAQAIGRWDQSHVADRVRAVLVDRLPNGALSLGEMARALGTSTRALQRRLGEESTTYARIVDDTRCELAEAYLREGRYSMSDIAYLLGFAGAASFTRVCRRWWGVAPSAYRSA
jgi:AraC-like DNA-binding protein